MIIKIPPAPGIISGLDPAEPEAASGVGRIPDLAAPSVDENSFLSYPIVVPAVPAHGPSGNDGLWVSSHPVGKVTNPAHVPLA